MEVSQLVCRLVARRSEWRVFILPMYVEDVEVADDFEATDADYCSTHSDGEGMKVMAWSPFLPACDDTDLID
eukprot:10098330-Karenia_brevis.AAC.1